MLHADKQCKSSMQCLCVNNILFASIGTHQHLVCEICLKGVTDRKLEKKGLCCLLLASIHACPVADLLRVT